ncbi:hypothetical protein MUCCIDRAFT_106502 [Mucor lusitanicus CBS 277.49]|uniref:Uncharacterized protein n=1 Tax=Mucor lusitanicus CBS 277.49 TaxID=747725 RepID=A0A168N8L0_MUCCL|nr:hypothetical protein MUCCIDRAFT_106502 [Mucor lusitanicus CBS 277.49]
MASFDAVVLKLARTSIKSCEQHDGVNMERMKTRLDIKLDDYDTQTVNGLEAKSRINGSYANTYSFEHPIFD